MRRGVGRLPKQGDRDPWLNCQNYYTEKERLPHASFDDGVLHFDNPIVRTARLSVESLVKRKVEDSFADWQGKAVFHQDPIIPTIDEWTEV
jgi:hypothetical protein